MTETNNHHRLDYVEFGTSDLAASKAFFSEVFGWKFTDYGPDYTAFKDGRLDGGFTSAAQPSTGGPLVVLFSSALETTLAAAQKAGAIIVKPTFSFPGGRRFHFVEPGGNELAVWGE